MLDFYKLKKNQFYIKRKSSLKYKQTVNYENDYWHIIKDPDGETRCRINERGVFLEDAQYEIQYINRFPRTDGYL